MASVPYEFACDKDAGFLADPNANKMHGYITALNGFGLGATLASDLQVHTSYNSGAPPTYTGLKYTAPSPEKPMGTAKVVGVLEKFSWAGNVGGTLEFDIWMSQENAFQIKALQQLTLKNTSVTALAWWVGGYDQEVKTWYEASHPLPASGTPITGIVNGQDGNMDLDVDLAGAQAAAGIDVLVYKVSIKVAPAANFQYTFHMANSSQKKTVKSWGLVVGTMALASVPAAS